MELSGWVHTRGDRWRVTSVQAYDACRLVTLVRGDATDRNNRRRLLTPFDDLVPIVTTRRARLVNARRWRRTCRALLASEAPPGSLISATAANFDLFPHQLLPTLAVLHGLGSRLLLADDVGLGKTVETGLVIAELIARKRAERVLVLTPAGVRDQWIAELRERFALDFTLADAHTLRHRAASLPFDLNPWTSIPRAIASIDYAKRPEVLPAITACHWDIVVIDEAHTAVGDSDRRAAVERIAAHASYVLLLTATPHSGDERAFITLRRIGSARDPLLIFRRTRRSIHRGPERRVHSLFVRPSAHELQMFATLDRYRRAALTEHHSHALALSVLQKRASSSPWALAQSVERRLASLNSSAMDVEQMRLPLDDGEGERDTEDTPPSWPTGLALTNADRERRLLVRIAEAARAAASSLESKVRVLRRLLPRVREPVIVFTEFRDTAFHVSRQLGGVMVLHGGLDRDARSRVIAEFESQDRGVLVATDAAGQGLNLHRRCRIVVNLELPWNPMRLEQRIGRVDRIGQSRRVHAWHLVSREPGERAVLAQLRQRIAAAKAAIHAADPLRSPREIYLRPMRPRHEQAATLATTATSEGQRIALARSWQAADDDRVLAELSQAPWLVLRSRRWRTRRVLAGRSIFIYQLAAETSAGNVIASHILALSARTTGAAKEAAPIIPHDVLTRWRAGVDAVERCYWTTRFERERRISIPTAHMGSYQAALFDRRTEREHVDRQRVHDDAYERDRLRIAALRQQSVIADVRAELLLVLTPRA